MNNIKVLIADDHPFFRDGIRQMLAHQGNFSVIDEASNGNEVMDLLSKNEYDLVIMDIKMPELGGIEAARRIKKKYPNVKVLGMSMFDEQPYIVNMLRAGAKGYVLKNSSKEELLTAIRNILSGDNYLSKEVSNMMITQLIEGKPLINEEEDYDAALTKREKQIIKMIAEEQTNVQIGKALGISSRTVDVHRRNILQKLRVKNTAGLVKYAMRNGIIGSR
ncbi:MAG TPA: response regulator transcription factor [Chitinophagales bacterium]|nr:response regulator transcription factor [Chitinophagales bacterium]